MVAPRYTAKRVGDDYELVRQDSAESAACYAHLLGGAALAIMGLKRRSLPGLMLAAVGGGLIYRGMTGQNPLSVAWDWERRHAAERSPSYARDEERRGEQVPQDEIDEASMESFPASDPPAHSRASSA